MGLVCIDDDRYIGLLKVTSLSYMHECDTMTVEPSTYIVNKIKATL